MSSFDQMKEMANNAAQSAAKTAKYMAFVSKCRLEILAQKERIRRNYAKIGKIYYKDFVTDEEPDEAEYKPLCDSVSRSYRIINHLEAELERAREEYRGICIPEEEPEAIALEPAEEDFEPEEE